MTEPAEFVSRLISAGAAGYAAAAANRLIAGHPETAGRFGARAFADWQAHLEQRLEELSAALLAGEAELFVSEVIWSHAAFRARQVPAADLEASLDCLRQVLDDELPPAAGRLPVRFVELAIAGLHQAAAAGETAPAEAEPAADDTGASETTRLGLVYLEVALSGDRRRAVGTIIDAVDGGLSLSDAFAALAFAQQQVGELWHAWQIGVAQEHFVTETTRSVLAVLAERAERAPANAKTVVVASAPGNAHDIGTRMVAAAFELAGWRTVHLGGAMPAGDLALGLEAFEADLLALSMSLATQLRSVIEVVDEARAARPGIKVLVGGRSLGGSPGLVRRIGADACGATADEAVQLGARLVGLEPDAD